MEPRAERLLSQAFAQNMVRKNEPVQSLSDHIEYPDLTEQIVCVSEGVQSQKASYVGKGSLKNSASVNMPCSICTCPDTTLYRSVTLCILTDPFKHPS